MAKTEKGILDSFNGALGTVIGGTWRGIPYMRSKPVRKKRIRTEAQLIQQEKFTTAALFVGSFEEMFKTTLPGNYSLRKTAANSAIALTIESAVKGTYPDFEIEYSAVKLSRGRLANVTVASVDSVNPGKVDITWTDMSNLGVGKPNDSAMLMAYCPDLKVALYNLKGAPRNAQADQLNVTGFTGYQLHVWLAFRSEKGSVSDSVYLGPVTVA